MKPLILFFIILFSVYTYGQLPTVPKPESPGTFSPITPNKSYTKPSNVKLETITTNNQSKLQGKKANELVKYNTSNTPKVIYESLNKNNY